MTDQDFTERLENDISEDVEVSLEGGDNKIHVDGTYINAKWNEEAAEQLQAIHGDEATEELYNMIARAIGKHTDFTVA